MSTLTPAEQKNVDAGLTTDGREIVPCIHGEDWPDYDYWYEDGVVELPEFISMVQNIWDSDWYLDAFENIPNWPNYVLKDQATAWFLDQPSLNWNYEAARDFAHEFLEVSRRKFGWK